MKSFAILGCLLLGTFSNILGIPLSQDLQIDDNLIQLSLGSPSSPEQELNLKLSKRQVGESILHPDIRVITVGHEETSGEPVIEHWTPTEDERMAAEDVYLDRENRAAVRVSKKEDGTLAMNGVVEGHHFQHDGKSYAFTSQEPTLKTDYIDLGISPEVTSRIPADEPVSAVIEIAIVCEKAWGDLFQHNRQKILEFWSLFYWDMNMSFQTLPSVNISIRITSITVFSSIEAQGFIEESRNEQGHLYLGAVLTRFGDWIGAQYAANAIPKYDTALLAVRSPNVDGIGGVAFLAMACIPNRGVGVHEANDLFYTLPATHELAHILNARHRRDLSWCEDQRPGLIMSMEDVPIRLSHFFDTCNDLIMSDFIRSDKGACLREINEPGQLPVDPSFETYETPTLLEICQRGLNTTEVSLAPGDEENCYNPGCVRSSGGGIVRYRPLENARCLSNWRGHCFRGRCLKPSYLLKNVGSGDCILGSDRFNAKDSAVAVPCPLYPNPLDRFQQIEQSEDGVFHLALPYSNANATENTDKCLWTGNGEGHELGFEMCTRGNVGTYKWKLQTVEINGEFFLVNANNGAYAIQAGSKIKSYTNFDTESPFARWRLV